MFSCTSHGLLDARVSLTKNKKMMESGCTMERRQSSGGNALGLVLLGFSGIHVDVTLTSTTYLNTMATAFTNGTFVISQENKYVQEWLGEHDEMFKMLTWLHDSAIPFNCVSVR